MSCYFAPKMAFNHIRKVSGKQEDNLTFDRGTSSYIIIVWYNYSLYPTEAILQRLYWGISKIYVPWGITKIYPKP